MANEKVIIPLNAYTSYSGSYCLDHRVRTKLADIEKCFNYLDGGMTDDLALNDALTLAQNSGQTKNIDLKYFKVTFYKKGTCHIVFKNEELLKKLNIYGSQKKGWLPPAYGKKKYSEMNLDEQAVINAFEGEKEYAKVMAASEYYFSDVEMFLLDCAS